MVSLVDTTLDKLLELVFELKEGGLLPPQDQLSERFDVSRTVLREAIAVLGYLGVLSVKPKRGTLVNPPSHWIFVNTDVIEWRVRAGEMLDEQLFEALSEYVPLPASLRQQAA